MKEIRGKMENKIENTNKMTGWDYLQDASGQVGLSIITLTVGQLTYFYTDKLGVAAGLVGTWLFAARLTQVLGILIGDMIDKSKMGNRKYIIWMGRSIVPGAVGLMLMFTVPTAFGDNVSGFYIFLTNFLLISVITSFIGTPYSSLQVIRTSDQAERSKMGLYRSLASYVTGMVVTISIIPLTNLMGGDAAAWRKFGFVASCLVALFLAVCYFTTRNKPIVSSVTVSEDNDKNVLEKKSLKDNLKKLFMNKYWVMVLLMNLFLQVNFTLSSMAGVYYSKWIFGNDNLVALVGGLGLIPTVLGFVTTGMMVKRWGVVGTMRNTTVLWVVSLAVKALFPTNFIINVGTSLIGTYASIPTMSLMGVMAAMSIDYNEFLYKDSMVALSNATVGFGNQLGGALATAFLSAALSMANYSPTMTTVTEASRIAIYAFSNWLPLIVACIVFFIYLKFDLEKILPTLKK